MKQLQIDLSLVESGKTFLKHRLSSGQVLSTNQGRRQRNNCLRVLNEAKGFISKFIFSHEAEGRVKKETTQCHTV